jgi:hypothetical protein
MFAYDRSYLKPLAAGLAAAAAAYCLGRFVLVNIGFAQLLIAAFTLIAIYVLAIVAMGLDENDKTVFRNFRARAAGPATNIKNG